MPMFREHCNSLQQSERQFNTDFTFIIFFVKILIKTQADLLQKLRHLNRGFKASILKFLKITISKLRKFETSIFEASKN